MTRSAILERLKSIKHDLNEKFGIEALALFGSYSKDEQHDESDIDILVMKMKNKNAFTLLKAKKYLSEELHKEVDLGLFDSLRPFIRKRVENELIYV